MKSRFYIIIIIIFAVFALGIVLVLYQNNRFQTKEKAQENIEQPAVQEVDLLWKKYNGAQFGFTINYPNFLQIYEERTFFDIEDVYEITVDVVPDENETIQGAIPIYFTNFSGYGSGQKEEQWIHISLTSVLPTKYQLTNLQAKNLLNKYSDFFPALKEKNEVLVSDQITQIGKYDFRKIITEFPTYPGNPYLTEKSQNIIYIYTNSPHSMLIVQSTIKNDWQKDILGKMIQSLEIF